MGALNIMASCATLNKFIHYSLKCVVYNMPIQNGTASKRMLTERRGFERLRQTQHGKL